MKFNLFGRHRDNCQICIYEESREKRIRELTWRYGEEWALRTFGTQSLTIIESEVSLRANRIWYEIWEEDDEGSIVSGSEVTIDDIHELAEYLLLQGNENMLINVFTGAGEYTYYESISCFTRNVVRECEEALVSTNLVRPVIKSLLAQYKALTDFALESGDSGFSGDNGTKVANSGYRVSVRVDSVEVEPAAAAGSPESD